MKFEAIYKMLPLAAIVHEAQWETRFRNVHFAKFPVALIYNIIKETDAYSYVVVFDQYLERYTLTCTIDIVRTTTIIQHSHIYIYLII